MKLLLATFALIFMAQAAMAQEFTTLNPSTINNNQLIRDLRDLGAAYVSQQGMFVSTKAALVGDYFSIVNTEKVERQVTPTVTYYRFTVTLNERYKRDLVRATYTVNYKPSNGGFVVSSYRYNIIKRKTEKDINFGGYVFSVNFALDARSFNSNKNDLSAHFASNLETAITNAIDAQELPNAEYKRRFVYDAYSLQSQDSDHPVKFVFLVKLVNDKGDFYRMQITTVEQADAWGYPQFVVYPNA